MIEMILLNLTFFFSYSLISFPEFQAFEALLCQPDSIYKTAFQLFDRNSSGTITHDEFEKILKKTTLHEKIPFDFKSW